MGLGQLTDVDAVTFDAYGTLVELEDPIASLRDALHAHGIDADEEVVRRGFAEEVAYYKEHVLEGDAEGLADLRRRCAAVFLAAVGANLEPSAFADDFQRALRFVPLPGVVDTLDRLRAQGLQLGVVSNWDAGLEARLREAGIADFFSVIVTAAEAGVRKPDSAIFALAVERLGVEPARMLHVGDNEEHDAAGAAAAGLRFAPAPL